MTRALDESPVSLDKLDDHLRALLRLKIREFVHLSPWFKDVATVDPICFTNYRLAQPDVPEMVMRHSQDAACPNRKQDAQTRRRHVRVAIHATN